jgi:hypothetical protein
MTPLPNNRIDLRFIGPHRQFDPGTLLVCEYEINQEIFDELQAAETSIIWTTEGKGDEDMGVHFFVRRNRAKLNEDRSLVYRFETKLPPSPLSYDGSMVKIRWLVRVKLFLKKGKVIANEREFRLGRVGLEQELFPAKNTGQAI